MKWGNIVWWGVYTCLAVILQAFFPGVDFLLPGFIVAIQERNPVQLLWVGIVFLLLQEGMGSMAFGGTLLWYSMAIGLFYLGYSLFEVESFVFIFLLSACLGASHYLVFTLMANLQDIPVNEVLLMEESIFQALLTPFMWRLAYLTRRLARHDEDTP